MIPLMKNAFIEEQKTKKALSEFILETPRLSMDIQCYEFEKEFALFQERKHAVLFNSGSSANLALLQSLKNVGDIKTGEYIGVSALTWATNVMPIIQLGMIPVPIDCDLTTLNVMSHEIKKTLNTVKLDAIFITNVLGFTGDLNEIKELCDNNGIVLIEDNCESLGTELPSGKAGNFSIASTFSFFVAHHMSTIEGGMVCTDDDDLSEMLRIVRANGWDRNLTSTQQMKWRKNHNIITEFDAKYTFYDLGYNFRPTEITGFLGRCQLKLVHDNILKRESNYMLLESVVSNNNDLILLNHSHIKTLSSFAFPVLCKNPELRNKYILQFSGAGVEIRPMIAGNIQMQPFYHKYVNNESKVPKTDKIHFCGFYCGNYPELSKFDLEVLKSCLGGSG